MDKYLKTLALPSLFIDSSAVDDILSEHGTNNWYSTVWITRYLDRFNPDLLDCFKQLKLQPTCMLAFGHQGKEFSPRTWVHADIHQVNGQWKTIPFSLNWELTDTNPVFSWYDCSAYTEHYPPELTEDYPHVKSYYELANGIHYGERYADIGGNISNAFTPEYSYQIVPHVATLIKTSVPHNVAYSGYNKRLMTSVRFDTDMAWESVLELFKEFWYPASESNREHSSF